MVRVQIKVFDTDSNIHIFDTIDINTIKYILKNNPEELLKEIEYFEQKISTICSSKNDETNDLVFVPLINW